MHRVNIVVARSWKEFVLANLVRLLPFGQLQRGGDSHIQRIELKPAVNAFPSTVKSKAISFETSRKKSSDYRL